MTNALFPGEQPIDLMQRKAWLGWRQAAGGRRGPSAPACRGGETITPPLNLGGRQFADMCWCIPGGSRALNHHLAACMQIHPGNLFN